MIQVSACKKDARDTHQGGRVDTGETGLRARQLVRRGQAAKPPTLPVAPAARVLVPPDAIAEVQHVTAVRTSAMLAAPFGAAEPNEVG